MQIPADYIHIDNAAATKVDDEVVKAMVPYLSDFYAVASSQFSHQPGIIAGEALNEARESIAQRFGVSASEVIFTSGGTESNNLAVRGYITKNKPEKARIITTRTEHYSVLNTCRALEEQGAELVCLDPVLNGCVDPQMLKKELEHGADLVTIQHVNQETGSIQPVEEIARLCRDKGVPFHTDAVLSGGRISLDLSEIPVSMLSLSGNAFHGPKGIGVLIKKKAIKLKKVLDGGYNENDLRPGTENIAGAVGFAKALELMTPERMKYISRLDDRLSTGLLQIEDSLLNGNADFRIPGLLNISFERVEGEAVILHLDMKGIAVITGSACFSRSLEPSYVLMSM